MTRSAPSRLPLLPGLLVLALTAGALAAGDTSAQEVTDPEWNSPAALTLVQRARAVRQASAVDSTLQGYAATAQGFVYFFLDRADQEEHTLIKADQIALEVYWRAPGETRQRIVGMRDEKVLPTNINYHLDHLTVVQDDFGDLIRLGDGDEVAAVIHPVAPGSETIYDYRLGPATTLNYPGLPEPVRVQQLQVRPRDPEGAGFVGTLYVDLGTSAIVRMTFTFTAASYVDPYLDYIRIALDNGLWMGKHWLPYRQEVELRRELPQLDFMAGSIIRGRWRIGDYEFNPETPDHLFRGPRITAVPRSIRERHPFQDSLFSDLEAEGLASSQELKEIEEQARSMALSGALNGLSPYRLHLTSVSDAVRRNRMEGWSVGMGATLRSGDRPLRVLGGYSIAAAEPRLEAEFTSPLAGGRLGLTGYWNRVEELGPFPGISSLLNTLATLGGTDYHDTYWASGGALEWSRSTDGGPGFRVTGVLHRARSGTLNVDDDDTTFRPVIPVTPGLQGFLEFGLDAPDEGDGPFWEARLRAGDADGAYMALHGGAGWSATGPARRLERHIALHGGWVGKEAPIQELALLGGRGTIPGFSYRATPANQYLLARGWLRRTVLDPWVSLRTTGSAGWSRLQRGDLPPGWPGDTDPGLRGSLGVGVDLLWEVIHLDLARGLPDGDWSFYLSVSPRFRPWL